MKRGKSKARSLSVVRGSADWWKLKQLREAGYVTRPGNPNCAFTPGTSPLLCMPVEEYIGKVLLPNT